MYIRSILTILSTLSIGINANLQQPSRINKRRLPARYSIPLPQYDNGLSLGDEEIVQYRNRELPGDPVKQLRDYFNAAPLEKDHSDPVKNVNPGTCIVWYPAVKEQDTPVALRASICLAKEEDVHGWKLDQSVSYHDVGYALDRLFATGKSHSPEVTGGWAWIKGPLLVYVDANDKPTLPSPTPVPQG